MKRIKSRYLFSGLLLLVVVAGTATKSCTSNPGDKMATCDKILNGVSYTDEEWNEYLKSLHARISGVTRPFAFFRTTLGPDTYRASINLIPEKELLGKAVLDLGCGDGFQTKMLWEQMGKQGSLTGLDLVPQEIEAARIYIADPRVTLLAASAQQTTLAEASQDTILAHLVLMLVLPLEPAVNEIARILKPGGALFAVVTRPGPKQGTLADLSRVMEDYARSKHPGYQGIRSGDERTLSEEGLKEIFSADRGFNTASFSKVDYDMQVIETPEKAWEYFFATLHRTLVLPAAEQAELKSLMISKMGELADAEGKIHIDFPLRFFSIRRK